MRILTVTVGLFLAIALAGLGTAGSRAFGQGQMSPQGSGMSRMGGMGMMGGPFSPTARPLSMDQAVDILQQWPAAHHIDGLVLDEAEAYTENFYGQYKERSTGMAAIQVLVDRYTGRAMPEMGPNMMWNTKYGGVTMQGMMGGTGMMGGMMNSGMGGGMMGGGSTPNGMMGNGSTPPANTSQANTVSKAQARQNADRFLATYLPGTHVGDGDAFYGYYHFDVLRGLTQIAMLSVNAGTGDVWFHTWHGEFLAKREVAHP